MTPGWIEPRARPCPCGSGLLSHWLRDARGIEVARVCAACEDEKKKRVRPDVLVDSQYWTDEEVEAD
jgi:hypothetical protein